MKSLALLVLLLVSSTSVFATNRVETLKQQSPRLSSYVILKAAYLEAKDPITIDDIGKTGQLCVVVGTDEKSMATTELIHLTTKKVVAAATPEVPAHGPLLPAIPAKPEQLAFKDGIVTVNMSSLEEYKNDKLFDFMTTQTSDSEITTMINGYKEANVPQPYSVTVRKNGELLVFVVKVDIGKSSEQNGYGYCWHQ